MKIIKEQNQRGSEFHWSNCKTRKKDPDTSVFILHRPISFMSEDTIQNTRERPSVKFVKLSNNHIVGLVHKHHIINEI